MAKCAVVSPDQVAQAVDAAFAGKQAYRPTLMLAYGPPGAGKTTIVRQYMNKANIDEKQVIEVSVDAILERLGEFRQRLDQLPPRPTDRTDLQVWRQARSDIYKLYRECGGDHAFADILVRALAGRYDIVYETTGANITATPYELHRAQSLGYHTVILYPFVPLATTLERVVRREEKTGQVAANEDFITEAFMLAQDNLIPLAADVDDIYLYDNLEQPQLVFHYWKEYTYEGTHVRGECLECRSKVLTELSETLRTWITGFCAHCARAT